MTLPKGFGSGGGGGAGSADVEKMIGRRVENMTGMITASYLAAWLATFGGTAAGYFVYLTLNFILDGVLDDIKQQRMFAQALDNRVKTMNSELIRIDVKMCQAFGIRPDTDRIARADGKTDARRD